MENYIISCCSTADISKEHFEKIDVKYTCFSFELDGVRYTDDLGNSIPFKEFYSRMANGSDTKTSQVNTEEYAAYFRSFLEQGLDVIHLTLSSGISGSINSANIAKAMLQEEFPDRKLYVVDSLAASGGFGLIMDKMSELRAKGMSIDELYAWVEENKLRAHHWFFTTDLTFFIKGGRVSKTAGAIGQVLNICPLLNVDFEGHLIPRMKVRTKKKVIQAIVDKMVEHAEGGLDYSGKVIIDHADRLEDALEVAALVKEKFPKLDGEPIIGWIGTTIGAHTGPGTVTLFFWGDKRVD